LDPQTGAEPNRTAVTASLVATMESHGSYGAGAKSSRGFKQPGGLYKWRRGGRPYYLY
jgi:hypothetical protein